MKALFANPRRSAFFGVTAYPLFMALLLAYDLCFRYLFRDVGNTAVLDIRPCLFSLGWVLVMGALLIALPRVASKIFMLIFGSLFAVLGLVHGVFFNLFGSFFSLRDMLYSGDGARFFSFSFLATKPLLWIATGVFVLLFVFCFRAVRRTRYRLWRIPLAAVLAAAGILLIFSLHTSLHYETDENGEVVSWSMTDETTTSEIIPVLSADEAERLAYHDFNNPSLALPLTGLYHYSIRDVYVIFRELTYSEESVAVAEIEAYHDENAESKNADTEYSGIFEGKNLILIMAESLDTWELGEDVTPNICALQENAITFQNHYTPLWLTAGTFSTEYVTLTGVIPPQVVSSTSIYTELDYHASLPSLFAAKGYTVNSFHASNPEIYNRGAIHTAMGFTAYHNWEDMGMTHYLYDSEMIRGYNQMVDKDNPFFSFIITISGHGPYGQNDAYADIAARHMEKAQEVVAARGYTGEESDLYECACALSQIMETDDFVGKLVRRLERDGLLDDTVIVIFGDHYSKYLSNADFTMGLKCVSNYEMLCNTPFIIYSKGMEAKTVTKCTFTPDVYPTLAKLFSLDTDLGYYVGNDALGTGGGTVFWTSYNWYDGTYHEGDTSEISEQVKRELLLSRNSLKYNFFATHNY